VAPLTSWQDLPILRVVEPENLANRPGKPDKRYEGITTLATKRTRNSRKSLALALAVVGVAGLSMASAAQLTVISPDVVAGRDAVVDCDADGVTVTYTPVYQAAVPGPGYVVTSVVIGDNDGTCTGTIRVTVTDVANASLASGTAAYAAGSVTVPLGTTIAVSSIYGVAVAIG
jgi:hypothetical protein